MLLGRKALPFNYRPIPVQVVDWNYDKMIPYFYCPVVLTERKNRENSTENKEYMNVKHNSTIRQLAVAFNADPNYFTSLDAVAYIDSLWSRHFE